ncbi:Arc family DNA-binding protein [Methylobacterium komagatae]|uniref:Arc family DNA-binding protein n=1 Tax=Methylobacterium komagatae TaxID=374425 RepID=A0ABW2BJG1_9HYPH
MRKPRSEYPSEQADKFLLRFPDGMRDRLKALAEQNKRSMNAEIVARLEASIRSQDEELKTFIAAQKENLRPGNPEPFSPTKSAIDHYLKIKDELTDIKYMLRLALGQEKPRPE